MRQRVSECIDFVGLEENADQRLYTSSGGMKRRANLAAGILNRPKVLFLDEPTVGIDPQSRSLILERLSEIKKNTTMIYTTHYMGEVETICSTVAIMDEGAVIAEGTTEELVNRIPGCAQPGRCLYRPHQEESAGRGAVMDKLCANIYKELLTPFS
jgi:ABC-2 type transport system ATP-binding protein